MSSFYNLTPSTKSALIQLYFIELIENRKCFDDFYRKQKVGIKVLLPTNLKTHIIPAEEKKEVERKANSFIRFN